MCEDEDKVMFTPPEGFSPPSDGNGDTFDLVCTFKAEKDGKLCLTQLGDTPMPGYRDSEKKADKPGYGQMGQQMASAMQQGMGVGS